ncbi:MAG: aminotransferase class I/II-fold pyridoxal phosphate-dependent enzyme [Planctomycetaceae bacterium]|nr:aminotransferase class I/II-fold pyridoxal phosphate-dependent enzyme [Planctomycetaceae bacterium]
MRNLAQRVANTEASGIRRIFDLAANLANPVDLSIGQPDFDVPDPLKEKAAEAMRAGKNAYTPTQGGRELRSKLLAGPFKGYGESQLLVTGAVSGGLLLSYMALLNAGDEILIPDPYFVMYKQLAYMLDAVPVVYDTYPEWRLDAAKIDALVTPRTKAIVLGSPSNPTGVVYSGAELRALAEVVKKHDLIVIADDIYEFYCYDGPLARIRDFCPEHTLSLGGFSKSHAMTGWRVGWAVGPEALIQAMTKFQQFSFVCAPTPLQIAAAAAIDFDMSDAIATYKVKRDIVYQGLVDAGYDLVKPGGAFYIFAKTPWGTGTEFVEECIRNNLLVIPGGCFSDRDTHFRIAYCNTDDVLRQGVDILASLKNKR